MFLKMVRFFSKLTIALDMGGGGVIKRKKFIKFKKN
jgi:hypothetical protein